MHKVLCPNCSSKNFHPKVKKGVYPIVGTNGGKPLHLVPYICDDCKKEHDCYCTFK